jgi:endonuclease YncB( thermonuclease family)
VPAELKRVALQIPLPAVKDALDATLRLELRDGDTVVHEETRDWRIHPPAAMAARVRVLSTQSDGSDRSDKSDRFALYDPAGHTAAMLQKLKVPFERLKQLVAPSSKALILGKDALKQPPEGPWREALTAFVRDGGKVLILEQSESPDFLPTPLTQAAGRRSTVAFRRAADHPVLAGLGDDGLRWWAASNADDDHYVSVGNYRKPIRGNYLPLIDAGTMDGLVETPLLEEYEGKGSFLLCQMLLTDKATVAPPTALLLRNLLSYLASPTCYRTPSATALLAKADSPLRKALDETRLIYEDLIGRAAELSAGRFGVAVVDMATGFAAADGEALKAFAAAGGHVVLHRPVPEQQPALEALLGIRLRFLPVAQEPADSHYHAFRRSNDGLLAGISNHEFLWASAACFKEIRHEGCWWSWYNCPPAEFIADYLCLPADADADRAVRLTRPGGLLQVPAGNGYFLVNTMRVDEPVADVAVTVSRLRSLLLTNLGCTLRSEGGAMLARRNRLKSYEFFPIDLSPYANRALRDDKAAGIIGWTNQGENDMRALPSGRQTFADIPFNIATPKAAVVLHSVNANNVDLPKEVKGIKIGRRADVLFFLHTAGWCGGQPFKYRVNYEDGTSEEISITDGQQVVDWWSDPARHAEAVARYGLFIAWQGDNPMRKGTILPGYEWVNLHPDKPVRDLDFLTVPESGYGPVPVLAALTGAVNRASEGVVIDVIGTQGVKVRLGTQEQEVYYIGVAGIANDHPFYQQALAAHRALVVGQKVVLQSDIVTQDAEGRTLAYVYLGKDVYDLRNLVNAKLIGDGLGKLGNFAGNDRHRMYLENLGFIAQQGKKGMWGVAAP